MAKQEHLQLASRMRFYQCFWCLSCTRPLSFVASHLPCVQVVRKSLSPHCFCRHQHDVNYALVGEFELATLDSVFSSAMEVLAGRVEVRAIFLRRVVQRNGTMRAQCRWHC